MLSPLGGSSYIYVPQDPLCGGVVNGKDPFALTLNMFSFQFFIHTLSVVEI
jgi:hypothetical protein